MPASSNGLASLLSWRSDAPFAVVLHPVRPFRVQLRDFARLLIVWACLWPRATSISADRRACVRRLPNLSLINTMSYNTEAVTRQYEDINPSPAALAFFEEHGEPRLSRPGIAVRMGATVTNGNQKRKVLITFLNL